MTRYMNRFGFDRKPKLDYPPTEMSTSGSYEGNRLVSPLSPKVDLGRMSIGQDKLAVVPLQMAEVAAAVAQRRQADDAAPGEPHRQLRRPDRRARQADRAVGRDEDLDRLRRCGR